MIICRVLEGNEKDRKREKLIYYFFFAAFLCTPFFIFFCTFVLDLKIGPKMYPLTHSSLSILCNHTFTQCLIVITISPSFHSNVSLLTSPYNSPILTDWREKEGEGRGGGRKRERVYISIIICTVYLRIQYISMNWLIVRMIMTFRMQ